MAKVLGVGGVFFKTPDVEAARAWYLRVLGVDAGKWGAYFPPLPVGGTAWNPSKMDSDHFAPSTASFMINYVVDDLDGMLAKAKAEGVEALAEVQEMEGIGRFAHLMDPNGVKIELWEPAPEASEA